MQKYWTTTANDIVSNYRESLNSLMPSLKKVRIPVGVTNGYDAWDDISSTLYKHLVVEPITWTVEFERIKNVSFPLYETDYSDYSQFNFFIQCNQIDNRLKKNYFHSFYSFHESSEIFDFVLCDIIDDSFQKVDSTEISFDKIEFAVRHQLSPTKYKTFSDLKVLE